MSDKRRHLSTPGPFRADQLRSGDPYELSNGHPIECLPTGGRGARANLLGGSVLESDPEVDSAGVDTGIAPESTMLRAPDVAVGNVEDKPGWVSKAPPLAVEYADTGQDEQELIEKIADLQRVGTRYLWVVRLTGPRRVDIYESGMPMRTAYPGEELTAPGVLKNSLPVEALFERDAAHSVILRNLLQRKGYASIEAIRDEGKAEGKAEGEILALHDAVRQVLSARNLALEAELAERLELCVDGAVLRRWLQRAATAQTAAAVFED